MYLLRLDDASDFMDVEKWERMEELLLRISIMPLVGIIPSNKDNDLCGKYPQDEEFWNKVHRWEKNGWTFALHGYEHQCVSSCGGINPVHSRSEFAGISYEEQCKKIEKGYQILQSHGIEPDVFFAPSHTFDLNTLRALKEETKIRIISDTVANDIYSKDGFFFLPQQSGRVRKLPLKFVTFCYHPNIMSDADFDELEDFLSKNSDKFVDIKEINLKERKLSIYDQFLRKIYFTKGKLRDGIK